MHVNRNPQAFYERPFGRQSFIAMGPHVIAIVESHEPQAQVLRANGARLTFGFPRYEARAISSRDRSAYLQERIAAAADAATRSTIRAVLQQAEWGKTAPVFDHLLVTADSRIMTRLYPRSGEAEADWLVTRLDSPVRTTFRLDRHARILFADSLGLITAAEAVDGGEEIRVWRFRRPQ